MNAAPPNTARDETAVESPTGTLLLLLNEPLPRIKNIRQCLGQISPAELTRLLRANPEYVVLIDRYLRLFEPHYGARLAGDPEFELGLALELFSCHVARFMAERADATDFEILQAYRLESYWQSVSRRRLVQLFERLVLASGQANLLTALMLFQNLDLQDLRGVRPESLRSVLEFLKARNWDFEEVILSNLDFYDYVARIARDLGDEEFAGFLDGFIVFAVRVRMAREFADELGGLCGPDGSIPLKALAPVVERIPPESLGITLDILVRQGMVPEGIASGLLKMLPAE